MLTLEQNIKLQSLMALQIQLATVKAEEAELRRALGEELFPNPRDGVNNLELGNGWIAKFTPTTNYKLDTDRDKVAAIETAIANVGNEGSFLADRLIKWKPELSVAEYKKLEGESGVQIKALVDSVLTTTPGIPKFVVEGPKA